MEALQAAMALSEAVSVDSDTSKIMEGAADRAGGQRRRKQRAPTRSAFSSDTPSEPQQVAAKPYQQLQYQTSVQTVHSSGESPVLNNNAVLEVAVGRVQHSSRSSKSSPAQRQGPCGHCKTPYSPQWRKGPRNKPVLCNACGIRYLRNRHLGRAVPQKKRTTSVCAPKPASGSDSAAEASVDTLSDSTDMRGPFKKRRTKQQLELEMLYDEDTSACSYDASVQETMGSVGDLRHLLRQNEQHEQQACSDIHPAAAMGDTGAANNISDVAVTVSAPTVSTGQEMAAQGDTRASAAGADPVQPAFGTSVAMPGNIQPLLLPVGSINSASGGIYSSGFNMALALQLYQQQQQQQLLYSQQHVLASQGSNSTAALQTASSLAQSSISAGSTLHGAAADSQPGSPMLASSNAAGRVSSAPALVYAQSLQMQQLQGYFRQQQQAQLLQAASMLHGPSPLSIMSSANVAGLCLGTSGSLVGSLLQGHTPASSTAAPTTTTSLEIAPLVCGDKPLTSLMPTAAPATSTAALAAAGTVPSV